MCSNSIYPNHIIKLIVSNPPQRLQKSQNEAHLNGQTPITKDMCMPIVYKTYETII